jgi:TDG/mug DNA glycosylase family protein
MTLHKATSFPPIVAKNPHTLILGSMPGIKSLEAQQYYAHPQNAFWKIMARLHDAPATTYAERIALIKGGGLALWDTLKACERSGSLDTAIDDASIEVNDFVSFFKKHPRIDRVFFNGSKSEAEFKKRVLPLLSPEISARLSFARLPSTSPAHAGAGFEQKLKAWSVIRKDAAAE